MGVDVRTGLRTRVVHTVQYTEPCPVGVVIHPVQEPREREYRVQERNVGNSVDINILTN